MILNYKGDIMEGFLIAGFVIGLVFIVVSFFVKDGYQLSQEEKTKLVGEVREMILREEHLLPILSEVKSGSKEGLDEMISEKLVETRDVLNEDANAKMMALHEMYDGLSEKINHSHKEVVFLYDMLGEKGEELKAFYAKIDGMKKELQEEEAKLIKTYQIIKKKMLLINNETDEVIHDKASGSKKSFVSKEKTKDSSKKKKKSEMEKKEDFPKDINEKIFALKDQGLSVMEISKELEMGQGEVNLILGLYAKNR